jgi:hypothetical protein
MANHDVLEESEIIQNSQEWLNDHGHPSFSHLRKMAEEGTIESRDQLEELADSYNIQYDSTTGPEELINRIRLYMNLGGDFA